MAAIVRVLLILLLAGMPAPQALVPAAGAEAPLSPRQFTEACAQAFRAAAPDAKVQIVKSLTLKIATGDGLEASAFLDNIYGEYRRDPAAKDEIIKRYVRLAMENFAAAKATPDPPIDPARIVAVIRSREWLAHERRLQRAEKRKGGTFMHDPLVGDLIIVYGEDQPDIIRFFDTAETAKLPVPRAALRAHAVANLRDIIPRPDIESDGVTFIVSAGGNFEASLLLVPNFVNKLSFPVKGDHVVAIPTRDTLIITDSADRQAVADLRIVAAKVFAEGPHAISRKLYRYRDGVLTVFAE